MMKRRIFSYHRRSFLHLVKSPLWLSLVLCLELTTGCASIEKWLHGDRQPASDAGPARFSEQDNMRVNTDRKYRRMNRQRMEDESDLGANSGSLWVMEGQGAYLFSQNQMRMVGDLLNVKLEGGAKNQLQTKSRVIAKLLDRLENPRRLASAAGAAPGAPATPADPTAAAGGPAPASVVAAPEPAKTDPLSVQTVPTRIVEQLKDGSYRVHGTQPFMIGKREYKVIVSGIVRPQDFNDEGLISDKLLDPQFDIVSSRKGASM